MLRRQLDKLFGILRRRPAGWLALVGQLAALVGLPLPNLPAKDISSPFPCQQRRCGCMSAADCWNQCCCFSARERLTWAREHEAEVPDSLVTEAQRPDGAKPGTCCTIKNKAKSSKPRTSTGQGVLGFMARQCQGQQHTLWGAGEPAPVPHPFVTWRFDARPAGWCLSEACTAPSVSHIPLVPPPRY
jgi:hypothetical protein